MFIHSYIHVYIHTYIHSFIHTYIDTYIHMVCLHYNGPNHGPAYYTLLRYFSLKVIMVTSHCANAINSRLNKSYIGSLNEILFSFVQYKFPVRNRHIYLSSGFKKYFCSPIYISQTTYYMRIISDKKILNILNQGLV